MDAIRRSMSTNLCKCNWLQFHPLESSWLTDRLRIEDRWWRLMCFGKLPMCGSEGLRDNIRHDTSQIRHFRQFIAHPKANPTCHLSRFIIDTFSNLDASSESQLAPLLACLQLCNVQWQIERRRLSSMKYYFQK